MCRLNRCARTLLSCVSGTATALTLALSACTNADSENPVAAAIDTLPSGLVRVRNPLPGPPPAIQRRSADLRLGAADGEGPEVFGRVDGLEVDALGRIYVLDGQAKEVRVFAPDGIYLRTLAGPGEGPGELAGPTAMTWDRAGHLWIEDPENARFTVFDSAGSLTGTYPMQLLSSSWRAQFDDGGDLYVMEFVIGKDGPVQKILRLNAAIEPIDTFPVPAFEPEVYRLDSGGRTMAAPVPFAPRQHWTIAPDGTLWAGMTGSYSLEQRTLAGRQLRLVEMQSRRRPVTDAERREAMDQEFLRTMAASGAAIDPNRIPAAHPAWSYFGIAEDGRIWVVAETGDGGTDVDVFSADGVFIDRTRLDFTFAASPLVRDGHLYGQVSDALGVPYVVRAPLD